MKFEQPHDLNSIIKVIGVGGGGSNAVNHMFSQGIKGVDFLVCNTDRQALDVSPVPVKLQLGAALTEGLGAGSIPDRGKDAAHENVEQIKQLLGQRTKMVFITAGMGGGTGTGAAPVIARIARESGILTVGIVTLPFQWEGKKRRLQATTGIEEMRQAVDTLLIINNDRLRDLYGNLSLDNAFAHADNVLTTAARGIAEVITMTGKVNVDFQDVKTVMANSGVAIMGMSEAEGEDRALRAAQEALNSPLLNDNDIKGAKYVLLNITHGEREVLMDEITEITDHIQDAAGSTADVIWGYCQDKTIGDKLRVTLIATGFNQNPEIGGLPVAQPERKVIPLDAPVPTMITKPIANPVTGEAKAPVVPKVDVRPNEPYLKTVEPTPKPAPAPAPVVATPVVAPASVPAPPPPAVVAQPVVVPPVVAASAPAPTPVAPAPIAPAPPVVEPVKAEPVAEVPPVEVPPVQVRAVEEPELRPEPIVHSTEVPTAAVNELPAEEPAGIEPVAATPAPVPPPAPVEERPVIRNDRPVAPWMAQPTAARTEEPAKPTVQPAPPAQAPSVPPRPVEFEVVNTVPRSAPVGQAPPPPPAEERKVFRLEEDEAPARGEASAPPPPPAEKPAPVAHQKGVEERLARMRELSLKLRTPSGLVDLEKEPAYKRRNLTLTESPHSTDSSVSRYSLTEGTDENGEKRVELKRNNPYLHDNVD